MIAMRKLDIHTWIEYTFSSNCNINKGLCGLCFWASDPLIDRFYQKKATQTFMNVVICQKIYIYCLCTYFAETSGMDKPTISICP